MIDFNLEIKNIQPISIKDMDLNRHIINENTKKSIILYNISIAEIKSNNYDLAIKDLKKALSYNSGFSEAIKLLGLCYVNEKKYSKAKSTFKKLAEYDIFRDLAEGYIENLMLEKSVSNAMEAIRRNNASSKNRQKQSVLSKVLGRKLIIGLSILAVVVASLQVIYTTKPNIVTLSERIQAYNKVSASEPMIEKDSVQTKLATETTSVSVQKEMVIEKNTISEQKDIITEKKDVASQAYENLQKELEKTKTELDSYKGKYDVLMTLDQIDKAFKEKKYEEAANKLLIVKNMQLDDESKTKIDRLWTDLKSKGIWTIYNEGSKLYKAGKYKEALPKLLIASEVVPSEELIPWLLYMIGSSYKETSDNTNALIFLQKVRDNYPKSKYAVSSQRLISQID